MAAKQRGKIRIRNPVGIIVKPNNIEEALTILAKKRAGGAINFRGVGFQILYASYLILRDLNAKDQTISIKLEGLEDIDVYINGQQQYIQVKTSQNSIDAGTLWDLKVLQNFMEVSKVNPFSNFRITHNSTVSRGKAGEIGSSNISDEAIYFWSDKFGSIGETISYNELKEFLQKISIEKVSENFLTGEINKLLFEKFNINLGTELQYSKAIFYSVFEWSKNRKTINYEDLSKLFQSVKDSFSKFPINPAIQNSWITPVSYDISTENTISGFYDGKAARPEDIARGLPVRRSLWEKEAERSVQEFDAIVIKSSSGQGKSTLAWQVGLLMTAKNYTVYQLNFCTSYNHATAVSDFLNTRLTIGQSPIVILDGLSKSILAWAELAEMLKDKPVKLIITTREEDWIRYGGDNSRVSLKVIDISLSIQEAANIYAELKKNNKVHPSISAWQPAWEKVKEKELLIEYIFLLTQGQMIEERLGYQISNLAKEQNGNAKLEILRLIALADVLNIRIQSKGLTEHISNNIRFEIDRNEIYRQLEKEYYLRFELKYVEGLHPVRSQHLLKILHSHVDIQESLLTLLKIIDEDYIYDYFISAPFLFDSKNSEYYRVAATIVAGKTLAEIVFAIDGLMHLEPYKYWRENGKIFEEVFENGGFELFVYDAIPFNKLNTLQSLSETLKDESGSNIRYLLEQLTKLTKYSINDSALFQFVKYLQADLNNKGKFEAVEGVSFLFKWFKRVGVSFPNIVQINEGELIPYLETKTIGEASELFHFYSISNPEKYKQFITGHRDTVIAWIKRKTNTLSIYEQGDDIHINYLLDNDADKANELSVYRINIVHAFFPFFKHYCTSAIILPFPNEEIYKAVLQNAHKQMPVENLFDDFDVHINQIWAKTILSQYAASSSYEWQRQHLQMREKSVELVKKCTRLFEAHLERDLSKIRTLTTNVFSLATDFFKLDKTLKKYPSNGKKYFDEVPFRNEQKAISEWLSSFRNFVNQMAGLINPQKDNDRHLPVINLKSAVYRLSAMQEAYEKITEGSYKYFPTTDLANTESTWFARLSQTVQFYVNTVQTNSSETIVVASKSVVAWYDTEEKRKLTELYSIISTFEQESPFIFYLPTKIIEEENLNYAVIGVWGCDIKNEENLWDLSVGLRDLVTTNIHFFTFVLVDDDKQVTGAFRVNDHYFEKLKKIVELNLVEEDDFSSFLPIFPNTSTLSVLEGITLKTVPNSPELEVFFRMLMTIWKLSEYRNRLNQEVSIEKKWLQEIEEEYRNIIMQEYFIVYNEKSHDIKPNKKTVEQFLNKEIKLKKDEIVQFMLDRSLATG